MSLVSVSAPRTEHRGGCTFGSGFYRVVLRAGGVRFCQSEGEVEWVRNLLPDDAIASVQRDGFCLDGAEAGDARTPDVVDAESWLALPVADGMRELGLSSEAEYLRAYNAIEAAVSRRNNRESQTGVHASIVIKRKGVRYG